MEELVACNDAEAVVLGQASAVVADQRAVAGQVVQLVEAVVHVYQTHEMPRKQEGCWREHAEISRRQERGKARCEQQFIA